MTTYAQQANSGKDSSMSNSNNNNSSNANSSSDYSKKDEFRRYLEKTGVLDALTKVLVGLYEEPERPVNAIDYIKRYIGAPQNVDVEGLKRENDQLRAELEKLKKGSHSNQKSKGNNNQNNSNVASS
eukprot:CAMPEP_0116997884 /NCGR_PEP_ID=MMETSP0472-20121206/1157_1 /TAXON_ID=693140 ORGANISM="Tiarina fusus, Strain LIS" /NCGR_SAMPLE_ID=MMETSP0472 /ASSEMBLY_ACC=CAM_ASM_000603 /LENGTH=126 /DNA_ID=CAMNT_0004696885 /DNA_START=44 /DNA_END=424 /DNA_ORIENTATION=+